MLVTIQLPWERGALSHLLHGVVNGVLDVVYEDLVHDSNKYCLSPTFPRKKIHASINFNE